MIENNFKSPLIYGLNDKTFSFSLDLVSVYIFHVNENFTDFYPAMKKTSNDGNSNAFYHCTEGSGVIHLKNGDYLLRKDELLFVNYFDIVSLESFSESWKFASAFFHSNGLFLPLNTIYKFPFTQNENKTFLRIIELLQSREVWNVYKANNVFQGFLCDILPQITTAVKPSPYDEAMKNVLEYIQQHLNEELTVDVLSAKCSFSKNHFTNVFKRHIGMTPKAYIIKLKMETAASLLTNSNLPIAIIASDLAFFSPAHFTNCFKQYYGKTPFEYRHKNK